MGNRSAGVLSAVARRIATAIVSCQFGWRTCVGNTWTPCVGCGCVVATTAFCCSLPSSQLESLRTFLGAISHRASVVAIGRFVGLPMAPEAATGFISASCLRGPVALPTRLAPTCAENIRTNSVVTTGGKTIPNFCCKKHPSVADAPMCATSSLPLTLLLQTAVLTVVHAVFHAAENKW